MYKRHCECLQLMLFTLTQHNTQSATSPYRRIPTISSTTSCSSCLTDITLTLAVTNGGLIEVCTETKEKEREITVFHTPPELDEEDGCMDTTLCLYTHYNRLSYLILILVIYASD